MRLSALTEQLVLLLVQLVDTLGFASQPIKLGLDGRLRRLGAVQLLLCDLLLVHRVQVLLLQHRMTSSRFTRNTGYSSWLQQVTSGYDTRHEVAWRIVSKSLM